MQNFLGIPRDCFRQRYVISWSSCLHQALEALIVNYLEGTHTFGHLLNNLHSDNFISIVGRETNMSVPCFSLGMLFMRICYLAVTLNMLEHSGDGPISHPQGLLDNLTSNSMQFCSICPRNSLLTPAYLCMVVKVTC